MTPTRIVALLTWAGVCLTVVSCDPSFEPTKPGASVLEPAATADQPLEIQRLRNRRHRPICGDARRGEARCFAEVVTEDDGTMVPMLTPSGLSPSQLVSAYNLPSSGGSGITVAIVDAYDDPNAEADLAVYRTQYGLSACTTANGCFKKVNQSGSSSPLPTASTSWAGEIALDIEAVSAVCPSCNILLVEASTASITDLGTAVNTAVSLGANIVSNSYGATEASWGPSVENSYYNHSGVAIFASAGDTGYGVSFPAASRYAISVGGTTLVSSATTAAASSCDMPSRCTHTAARPSRSSARSSRRLTSRSASCPASTWSLGATDFSSSSSRRRARSRIALRQ